MVNEKCMLAFLFDTGKITDAFYGDTVFKNFIDGLEITENKYKVVFSEGDILDRDAFNDINPFIIRDKICSISNEEQKNIKGIVCVILAEDIEEQIAIKIDQRMKKDFKPYIGLTSIDINSTDRRKQFWKSLIRAFSIEYMTITAFLSEQEGYFNYFETAKKKGFKINCDGFPFGFYGFEDDTLFSTRQSSFIHNEKQYYFRKGENDADRGLQNMNFALVKEVGIAGTLIWKAIEDIDNSCIYKDDSDYFFSGANCAEYIFTSLYQASQGVERLQKIVLELMMYGMPEDEEKNKIIDLLMSHNHLAMWDKIQNESSVKLKPFSTSLLQTLYSFYNKARYHRYKDGPTDILELNLIRFFGKDLPKANFDKEVKVLYGKALHDISHKLYELIESLSRKLNIDAYEFRYDSTAAYVLSSYYKEDLYTTHQRIKSSKKELLWYLICRGSELSVAEYSESFPELPFEECLVSTYINEMLCTGHSNSELFEFVSNEYDELVSENKKQWLERIDAIDTFINDVDLGSDSDEEYDVVDE